MRPAAIRTAAAACGAAVVAVSLLLWIPRPNGARPSPAPAVLDRTLDLEAACQEQAAELGLRCDAAWPILVRPPWVLAGDLTRDELVRKYDATLAPAYRALQHEYLSTTPDRPITVLLFSTEAAYRRAAERLFDDRRVSRFGYFKPGRRTMLINLAEGNGGLLHELTHAGLACDFPAAPAWLDEGLASLHETCQVQADDFGTQLRGLPNWRLGVLRRELALGAEPDLQILLAARDLNGPREAVLYAQARGLCLWLQSQGLLREAYRQVRARQAADPQGAATLRDLVPARAGKNLESRFSDWLRAQA